MVSHPTIQKLTLTPTPRLVLTPNRPSALRKAAQRTPKTTKKNWRCGVRTWPESLSITYRAAMANFYSLTGSSTAFCPYPEAVHINFDSKRESESRSDPVGNRPCHPFSTRWQGHH